MKNAVLHLRNNFFIYFIVFSTLLSIISIIKGATAYKIDQYEDPFLAVVPISNFCWFVFTMFIKVPKQKTTPIEDGESVSKVYSDKYAWLAEIISVTLTLIIGIIIITNVSMGIIITLRAFLIYFAHVY